MDEVFWPAALAIATGDLGALADLLDADPTLATKSSSTSHPTLLHFVACDAAKIVNPIGAASLLVDAGADTDGPLISAAGCDSHTVVQFLLEQGADIDTGDTWSPLDEALYWSNMEMATTLIRHGARVRALSTAAGLGRVDLVQQFFASDGLRPNAGPIGSPFPETIGGSASDPLAIVDHAFVMAINNGCREVGEFLVSKGARVNAPPPGFHWKGTALHAAVWRNDASLVEWLRSIGADPSVRDGMTNSDAVGWATYHDHPLLIPLLQ
ncbi:MAG: ankyrin repeat domain-containing protein [Acidimicrobiales bacterium]